MATQRNRINEIMDRQRRRKTDSAGAEYLSRVKCLKKVFEERRNFDPEILKYFPVALVACIEGYFRLQIKQLIDAGDPYLTNAGGLLKEGIKFDFEAIKALHGKQISIGEFIAHNLSLSSLDNIDKHMTTILGWNFLKKLASVAEIERVADAVYESIKKTFEIRHIICHELATNFKIEMKDIERGFAGTHSFLKASFELINQALYPNAPGTPTEINNDMQASLDATLSEVAMLCDSLSEKLNSEHAKKLFNTAQTDWRKFMENWARFYTHDLKEVEETIFNGTSSEGATIEPAVCSLVAESLAKERIKHLKNYLAELQTP